LRYFTPSGDFEQIPQRHTKGIIKPIFFSGFSRSIELNLIEKSLIIIEAQAVADFKQKRYMND
jgi:hypothetical protein